MAKSEQDKSSNVKEGVRELKRLLPYLWTQKGILLLGLFCMIISIVMNFSVGIFIRYVIDDFPEEPVAAVSFLDTILMFGLIYIVVSAVVGYLTGYNFRKVAANVTRDIRSGIFEQLINKDLNYLDQQSSGDMQTRVVADTSAVGRFLADQIPTIVAGGLTLIVGIIGALYISVKLTLIVLFCLPFIFVPLAIFSPKLRRYGRLLQTAISDIGTFAGETFRNIKIVRAYNNEVVENNRFARLCNQAVTYILERSKLELGMSVIVNAMALSGFAVLLWSSGKDIVSGAMSIGELVAFAYFALMILQSGGRFLRIGTVISVAVGTSKKVLEYLADEKHAWPSSQEGVIDDTNIEFKAVSFSYPIRPDIQVLDNVDFKIDRGAHVALVGPSGAGKSTIFELLLSLYDSYEGEILVGGVDTRSLDVVQLRSIFGYVPQQESLVTGTVNDNISYGNSDASDEQIVEAAKMAHAHEFVEKLPKGYETDLGEVGDRLSGGQKQRIALARALIRKPKILLLDEAKSALDAASERLVADAIEVWANGQNATVFSIAHQLETVRTADLIIVVNDGVIVDRGSHHELLQRCDLYKKLSAMGFDDEAAEAVNE